MTTVGGIGEDRLIQLIKPYVSRQAGRDDAAMFESSGDLYDVVSTDMSVEGVHFDLSWMRPEYIGWRALALALGDLAAKGAMPQWALASIAIPRSWNAEDFVALFKGMHDLASRLFMAVEGGDLTATEGPAVISLTVAGGLDGDYLPRSGAQPGWVVAVTGPLGASAVALREHRVLRPLPLIEEGHRLNELGLCCGDISDGLVREMEKFLAMSGAGSVVRADDVPRAPSASVEDALTSGEEVQLVCVGPAQAVAKSGLKVVGEMVEDKRVTVVGAELKKTGYDHFA